MPGPPRRSRAAQFQNDPLGDPQGDGGPRGPEAGVTPRRPRQPALAAGDAPSSGPLAPGARKGCAHLGDPGAEAGEEPTRRSAIALEATTLPARAPRSPKDTTAPAEGQPRWPSTTRRREAARAPSMAAAGRKAAGPRLYLAPASGPAPAPRGRGLRGAPPPQLEGLRDPRSPRKKLNRNVTHILNCGVSDILFLPLSCRKNKNVYVQLYK